MNYSRRVVIRAAILLTILVLCVANAWKWYTDRKEDARIARLREARSLVSSLTWWCIEYRNVHGSFPPERTWARDLLAFGVAKAGFLKGKSGPVGDRLYDPWGKVIQYRLGANAHGVPVLIYSVGPNGIDESGYGDDISNAEILKDFGR